MQSLHGYLHDIQWIMFHGHLHYLQKPSFGGRSNTKSGDHGTLKSHNCWIITFLVFIKCEDPAWIEMHWNSIWLRARSHRTSHYTWGLVTTLHDFGSILGQPLDTSFGLSQFHGHGYCFVCEVALMFVSKRFLKHMEPNSWRSRLQPFSVSLQAS